MIMDHRSRTQLRAAAFHARLVFPGPGELLARELLSWDEFGHRLRGDRMIMRLVEHVLWTPAAGPVPNHADAARSFVLVGRRRRLPTAESTGAA